MASQQRDGSGGGRTARGRSGAFWGGRERNRPAFRALLAALVIVLAPFMSPGPASAGVGPSVTPSFPVTTTVGDQFVGSLFVSNNNSPPTTVNPITVVSLTLAPGCSVQNMPNCAGGVDPGVFTLGPVGTGSGACAGTVFGILQTSPGLYSFTPSAPVILPLNAQCRVDFNVTTTKVPTFDVNLALNGIQTRVNATVGVTSPDTPLGDITIATGTQVVTIAPAPATIATTATPKQADVNKPISDLATVTGVPGGPTPTGTVTFQVFGPAAPATPPVFPDCTGQPVFTSAPVNLTATGPTTATAGSGNFATAIPGNYVFVATFTPTVGSSYTGVTSACQVGSEQFTVNPLPTITVDKTATPLTRAEPGGAFTFNVVVTNTSAEQVTITKLTDDVYGNIANQGTCTTAVGSALTAAPGPGNTYACSFTGSFTGLAPASQTDTVTANAVDSDGNTATNTDNAIVTLTPAPPTILVDKTATPLSRPEPGGAFTFNVVVTNTGVRSLTLTSLTDNIYGNIATQGTCVTAIGTVLAASPGPGNTFSCSFTGNFFGNANASQTDVVTAVGVDTFGQQATDTDDAVVTLTNVLPTIAVVKTATPPSRPEPGGAFTFGVVVTNTSFEPVTITSLTDNIYGNIATQGTCTTAVGTVLTASPGPGNTYSCSFTGNFIGNAGASQTDIVTAVAIDNDGSSVTATANATVTLTNVLPTILVDKTATPTSRPEPGGAFTFNVVVTNTSIENVTITSLTDNIYGNIATKGTCTTAIGTVLVPGGTFPCSFTGNFIGNAGASQTDIVTATAVDDDGSSATANDNATVTLTNVPPTVQVVKTATPVTRLEPGGSFTFNVVVTNTSFEPVTITTLTDNIYGNIATQGTCTSAVGTLLAASPGPGNTYSCSFAGNFTGAPGATQTDIVTTTVVDNDNSTATATDDATVAITNIVPTILVDKTATPLSLPEPGGSFTFNVVVTNTSIEPVTITALTDNIYGNIATKGTCTTAIGTVLAANGGRYPCSFTGSFTGNAGASQTDVVTAAAVDASGDQVTASDNAVVTLTNVPPTIAVVKTAAPASLPEPGGAFTFNVLVTNTSFEPVTITALTDNIYGNIATQGTCTSAINTVLTASPGPGNTYSCSFTGNFSGNAGQQQTDIVTATAVDNDNSSVTATDDATVALTNVPPTVIVDKVAVPTSLAEPGGDFTFQVVVTNTSFEPVTITTLTDDVYGNLATQGTCTDAIGKVLQPAGTYSCSFTGSFTGNAGDKQTDVVTVNVIDNDNTTATDTDDATVTLTNVPPTVQVVKSATPETRPAPGGAFTFNVVVTNTSAEAVTITNLIDDVYGNIATQGTCKDAIGTVLQPGKTYSCSFTGNFTGASGSQKDVVTVTVVDNDSTPATANDDATVTITPGQVIGQVLNNVPTSNPTTPAPTATTVTTTNTTTTTTLPKTGAQVADLIAVALGLLALGGLLLLAGTRWVPAGQVSSLFAGGGLVSNGADRLRRRWFRQSRPDSA